MTQPPTNNPLVRPAAEQAVRSGSLRSFRLALLIVLILGLGIRGAAIVNTDQHEVLNRPIVDDSYYYFALGKHLAAGQGARIDAEHLTSGFQPLWGFMSVIPFILFPTSDSAAIITFQVMGIVVGLLCAAVIYRLAYRLSKSRWIALAVMSLWWLAPQGVVYQTSGMETGLGIFATMLVFYVLLSVFDNPSTRRVMLMGTVCGFAFLCRTDTLVLSAVVIAGMFGWLARAGYVMVLKKLTLFAVCMALILSPWLLFTRALGKGFMPESGDAVRLIAAAQFLNLPPGPANVNQASFGSVQNLMRLSPFLISYLQNFAMNLYVMLPLQLIADEVNQSPELNTPLITFLVFIGVLLVAFRRNDNSQWRQIMTVWWLYAVVMCGLYSFYVIGYWFNQRYTMPVSESLAVLGSCFLLGRVKLVKRSHFVALGASITLVFGLTYAMYYLLHPAYSWIFYGSASLIDNELDAASIWMNTHLAPTDRIGAFQSGLMGYYSHSQFINLDGKVNVAAHEAMRAGDIWNYICNEAKLNYVVDMQIVMDALLIHRSKNWQESNLTLVHGTNLPPSSPMWQTNIYRVNCSTSAQVLETDP